MEPVELNQTLLAAQLVDQKMPALIATLATNAEQPLAASTAASTMTRQLLLGQLQDSKVVCKMAIQDHAGTPPCGYKTTLHTT